jgi:hypothetical protein
MFKWPSWGRKSNPETVVPPIENKVTLLSKEMHITDSGVRIINRNSHRKTITIFYTERDGE